MNFESGYAPFFESARYVNVGETCRVDADNKALISTDKPVFWCCVHWGFESLALPDGTLVEVVDVDAVDPLLVTVRVLNCSDYKLMYTVGRLSAVWLKRDYSEEALADDIRPEDIAGGVRLNPADFENDYDSDSDYTPPGTDTDEEDGNPNGPYRPAPDTEMGGMGTSKRQPTLSQDTDAEENEQSAEEEETQQMVPPPPSQPQTLPPSRVGKGGDGGKVGVVKPKSPAPKYGDEVDLEQGHHHHSHHVESEAKAAANLANGLKVILSPGTNAGSAQSTPRPRSQHATPRTPRVPQSLSLPAGELRITDLEKNRGCAGHLNYVDILRTIYGGNRIMSGEVVRAACKWVTSARFKKLSYLVPLREALVSIKCHKDSVEFHFDFGKKTAMEVTTPSNKKWVLESGLPSDPYLKHPKNVLVATTTEARRFLIKNVLRFKITPENIASVEPGDICYMTALKNLSTYVSTFHGKRDIEYDSKKRPFLRVDKSGNALIDNNHYVPHKYDDWLKIVIFGVETLVGLPGLSDHHD